MTESQLRALLAEMADGEQPPSRVDAGLARRQGRARLRWRRALVAATSVLAAAAVAATAVSAGPILGGGHREAAAGPSAPRQFSPLAPYASFGWLPAGESLMQGGRERTFMYLTAGHPLHGASWELEVYAKGQCHFTGPAGGLRCHHSPSGSSLQLTGRAPAVRGRSAFWGGPNLVWQYAGGGWAWLDIPVASFSELQHDRVTQRQAIEIADHVQFGASLPLVFPAQLTGLTGRWQISDMHFWAGTGVLKTYMYTLTTPTSRFFPRTGDLGVWVNAPYIEIRPATRVSTCTPHDPASENTSEIIHGYRVVVKQMTVGGLPEQELCAARADGLRVSIAEFGSPLTIGVTSLFKDHLRLLGTDPANWTRRPIG